ncbi:MAG: CDP-glucose 4,6-dehydratase [marine bacterium B5-7]|nr:MAG: CDP-glucose 4,6-dehydratase [marine bacterium B5-7]
MKQEQIQFENIFRDKVVLITGHTGFKGSWLSLWLTSLGAKVVGISKDIPTEPSHFKETGLDGMVRDIREDLRHEGAITKLVCDVNPDFVFHLAAQALVKESYRNPLLTYSTNIIGTANLLNALRSINKKCVAVLITSDKCYKNLEWVWGYRETDSLGGKDPYSASKASAELVIRSFIDSFFGSTQVSDIRIGIGRAGNVVGGGDWSLDRLVPDCVKSWAQGKEVGIRSPESTRPWQHVLEPLSGYLQLAATLSSQKELHGEAFNFGPKSDNVNPVRAVLNELARHWDKAKWVDESGGAHEHEAGLLKLNCDKALALLDWQATLEFDETIEMTANWYRAFYSRDHQSIVDTSREQIQSYCNLARQRGSSWANQILKPA